MYHDSIQRLIVIFEILPISDILPILANLENFIVYLSMKFLKSITTYCTLNNST